MIAWLDVGHVYRASLQLVDGSTWEHFFSGTRFLFDHVSPFLLLTAPIVYLMDGIGTFVALHGLATATAVAFFFLLAREVTRSLPLALAASVLFFSNPYLFSINASVHFEIFAFAGLIGFAYSCVVGRWRLAATMFALALMVKEDIWIYLVMTSVMLADYLGLKRVGIFTLAAIAYAVVIDVGLKLLFKPDQLYFLTMFTKFWPYGDSKLAVVWSLLTEMPRFLDKIVQAGYGYDFLVRIGFLILFAPVRGLIALGCLYLWLTAS